MIKNTLKTYQILANHLEEPVELNAGDFVMISPYSIISHDNSSAIINKFFKYGFSELKYPENAVIVLDHNIQDKSSSNLSKYKQIEDFALKHQLNFFPAGRGISHQVMCEEGFILPEKLVVGSDSHSNLYGALGCLGISVTRTDAAIVWGAGKTWIKVPPVVKVELNGKLDDSVSGKDVILTLAGLFNDNEVLGCAVEFVGDGVYNLSISERMTIANMTTEWGAVSGLFPVDNRTLQYFEDNKITLSEPESNKILDDSDSQKDSDFYKVIKINLDSVSPVVTGPDDVKKKRTIHEFSKKKVRIDKAYLLSCVNGRVEDFKKASSVLEGNQIAEHVDFYFAAASRKIEEKTKKLGYWQILKSAGGISLPPGCGPCIGLGAGTLKDNETAISATNRNFKGRMGAKSATVYLGSPEVVAHSAIKGYIYHPLSENNTTLKDLISSLYQNRLDNEFMPTDKTDAFPDLIESSAICCLRDNINTDEVFPSKYTYDDSLSFSDLKRFVMMNYDERFVTNYQGEKILIAGSNFGTGSSREQAVTAFKSIGISVIIAESFNETYRRNAINNGLILLESPPLVAYLSKGLNRDENLTSHINQVKVDFDSSIIYYNLNNFQFKPLSLIEQQFFLNNGIGKWLINR